MVLVPRLDLRQVQSLGMTPQLQQAIKLLQMSSLELYQFVEQEVEQNPLLDCEIPDEQPEQESDSNNSKTGDTSSNDRFEGIGEKAVGLDDGPNTPNSVDLVEIENITLDHDSGLDVDYENIWSADTQSDTIQTSEAGTLHWQVRGAEGFDLSGLNLQNSPADKIALRDHLIGQINVDLKSPVDKLIAGYLVDLLDEAGYLHTNLKEAAETLGCSLQTVERILTCLQQLDPPGIFARNLSDCIALQLKDRNRYDPAMQALVENLDLLGKREFKTLRRLCGVDAEDIADMIEEIKALNPKPALAFNHVIAQAITPDVSVRHKAGGGWIVDINRDAQPQVSLNNQYYSEISQQATRQKDKKFIAECYQTANWLVRALHQRSQTILKVTTEIVRHQEEFLNKGVQYLKPLVLRDIGKALDIHESTVSRVTTNKYVTTPRGIFELKYFFPFAVGISLDGTDVPSAEAIRYRVKALIDAELPENVLSDDKIVSILRNDGLDVARRTIAKYRKSMQILSSVQRRKKKTMLG